MPSQLPLPLTTSLRPGMARNALLLCSSRSHSASRVESDTTSVRNDLTFLAIPVDFYGCPHSVYFIPPLHFSWLFMFLSPVRLLLICKCP